MQGLVLLVDELSEFLRSKPDARAYNEDIRFLQYLGEEAASFPLWVIGALQEWIEETGEIRQDTFNKIKDRYPVRLKLGRAHIEDLVSERLIRHKEGADSRISDLFHSLKRYFPTFPVTEERFRRLYPVHPSTCILLDRLKTLFSEHRGVIDFIHFRLKGDPERHIPELLGRPAHELLGPDVIFDHFMERIVERTETQIYVERVYRYYEAELPGLFPDPDQRHVAMVAVKLLILFAISPVTYSYPVRLMAEMILYQVTPLETDMNYHFLQEIMAKLAREGSYVKEDVRGEPLETRYSIDLAADIAGNVRKRIRHGASEIFDEDLRLFSVPASLVDSPHLPLAAWVDKGRQPVSLQWQHTRRMGTLLLRRLEEVTTEELDGLGREWARGEIDFFVLVGTTHNREEQHRNVTERLIPFVRERHQGIFLFWIPSESGEDMGRLKELLAAVLMRERVADDPAVKKKSEVSDYLASFIERSRPAVTEYFHPEVP